MTFAVDWALKNKYPSIYPLVCCICTISDVLSLVGFLCTVADGFSRLVGFIFCTIGEEYSPLVSFICTVVGGFLSI